MPQKTFQLKQLLPFFFLSGMASLICELSWIRDSSLIFGSTLPALTTVTAIFFGGMALGSGRFSREGMKYSGKSYAKLQFGIAAFSLLSLLLFALFKKVTPLVYPSLQNSIFFLNLYRLIAVALIIGVPTFLMGATFPVMMAISPMTEENESSVAGLINGVNAFGAVAGSVLTGFLLLPAIGMVGSVIVAAVINLLIGVVLNGSDTEVLVNKSEASGEMKLFPALPLFFGIGFSGMAAQILWSRFLSLIIYNTVYTYTITIVVVITGLAIGSIAAGKAAQKFQNFGRLFGIAVFLNLTAMVTALYLPASFWMSVTASNTAVIRFALIAMIMFLPALFSGATFPLALRMIGGGAGIRGRSAGLLSMVNTTGGIIGSLLAGFWLLPTFGIGGTVIVISVVLYGIGIVAFATSKKVGPAWGFLILPIIPAVLLFRAPGEFILPFVAPRITQVGEENSRDKIVYLKEGRLSSVLVKARGDHKTMEIDRMWQGENEKNRQIMAAHLPMLLSEDVKKVLVVGVGPGMTAKRFRQYNVEQLDLVDIEPAVFEAAIEHFDAEWMKDSSVNMIFTDGKNYIRNTKELYDVISVEIGQIFRPHAAGFYTENFYESVKDKLSENGVVGQFVPVAAFDSQSFRRVIASFIAVFPTAQLWYNEREFILLGFNGKEGKLDAPAVAKWLSHGTAVYNDLAFNYWGGELFNLNRVENLAAGFLLGSSDLQRLCDGSKTYTDAVPQLEYDAAGNQSNDPFVEELDHYLTSVDSILPGLTRVNARKITQNRKYNLGNVYAHSLLQVYYETDQIAFLEKAFEYNPKNLQVNRLLGSHYYKENELMKAAQYLSTVFTQDPTSRGAGRQVSLIMLKQGDINGAVESLLGILMMDQNDDDTHALLGAALLQGRNYPLAEKHTKIALKLNPSNSMAIQSMQYLKSMSEQVVE